MDTQNKEAGSFVKELCPETFIFPLFFIGFFVLFAVQMGLANTLNTIMNTAYRLLIDTVLYITAVCYHGCGIVPSFGVRICLTG